MSTLVSPGSQDPHGPADLVITNVRVRYADARSNGVVLAYATVTFNHCLVIHDVKLIEKDGKRFVSMPARRSNGGKFTDIVHPTDRDTRDHLEREAWNAYERELRRSRSLHDRFTHHPQNGNGHDDDPYDGNGYDDDGYEGNGHEGNGHA